MKKLKVGDIIEPFIKTNYMKLYKLYRGDYFVTVTYIKLLKKWVTYCVDYPNCFEIDNMYDSNISAGLLVWLDRKPLNGEKIKIIEINENSAKGIVLEKEQTHLMFSGVIGE